MTVNPKNAESRVIRFAADALTLEGALGWAQRVASDQSELPSLLDELDKREVRQLVSRLMQVIGLLELKPAEMDPAYFIGRVVTLGYDYAFDPWASDAREDGTAS